MGSDQSKPKVPKMLVPPRFTPSQRLIDAILCSPLDTQFGESARRELFTAYLPAVFAGHLRFQPQPGVLAETRVGVPEPGRGARGSVAVTSEQVERVGSTDLYLASSATIDVLGHLAVRAVAFDPSRRAAVFAGTRGAFGSPIAALGDQPSRWAQTDLLLGARVALGPLSLGGTCSPAFAADWLPPRGGASTAGTLLRLAPGAAPALAPAVPEGWKGLVWGNSLFTNSATAFATVSAGPVVVGAQVALPRGSGGGEAGRRAAGATLDVAASYTVPSSSSASLPAFQVSVRHSGPLRSDAAAGGGGGGGSGGTLTVGAFSHHVFQRGVWNPLEDDDVHSIANVLDVGVELSTRAGDRDPGAAEEAGDGAHLRVAAAWQVNRHLMLKGSFGTSEASVAFAWKTWGYPRMTLAGCVTVPWQGTSLGGRAGESRGPRAGLTVALDATPSSLDIEYETPDERVDGVAGVPTKYKHQALPEARQAWQQVDQRREDAVRAQADPSAGRAQQRKLEDMRRRAGAAGVI